MTTSPWSLTPQQVIDSAEIAVLVFHNVYPEGKQGGLEIIQHGERIATNGDLRLEPAPGQWAPLPTVKGRQASAEAVRVAVQMAFSQPEIPYTVRVWAAGEAIEVAVDLEQPLPQEWAGRVGFNLELLPSAFFGKAFFMDETSGTFPRLANGPVAAAASGTLLPAPMACGGRLVAAPEDSLCRLTIQSHSGSLQLFDGRVMAHNSWFIVRETLPAGVTQNALRWTLTPSRVTGWQREPVILFSQVGYHLAQEKQALIELDPRGKAGEVSLLRWQPDGSQAVAKRAAAEPLGRFLHYNYARFDFSEVREPGIYQLTANGQQTPPFRVAEDVYREGVWQPTLETFLPAQMCHVRVEDGTRVWHGACHLDDALQAPANHEHFDGYRQYEELETDYPAYAHIPGLDRGGWHDAGDYDLAAGSQASTVHTLVLAREAFGLESDQTSVHREARLVQLHIPDGVPDVVQQVAHGVETLLGGYCAAGHCFPGIIEGSLKQYAHLGDAATMTDNQIYTGGKFEPWGVSPHDDRWAFTNRSSMLEYQAAAALAAASRVLRGYEDALAEECLSTAQAAWNYEQNHEPATRGNVYIGTQPRVTELLAAVELLITTGEAKYGERVVELWPEFEAKFGRLGWVVVRALPYLNDAAFAARVRQAAEQYLGELAAEMAANPFLLPLGEGWLRADRADHDPFAEDYHPPIWGIGWGLQGFAVHYYYLVRAMPDLFNREPLLRVLNYVLGCHPANNLSLVSGVGAQSLMIAYGTNRAEWSNTPGGIASGPALLRPNYIELMDPFPWLWQQKEYVIGGAASYIFLVLAAQDLLARE